MATPIAIDPHEPCERCGSQGDTRLFMLGPQQPAVLCRHCQVAHELGSLAEKEARLIADWGTLGKPVQAQAD